MSFEEWSEADDEEAAYPRQHRCPRDKQVPRRWRSSEWHRRNNKTCWYAPSC